jgi:hypothetical protein
MTTGVPGVNARKTDHLRSGRASMNDAILRSMKLNLIRFMACEAHAIESSNRYEARPAA